MPTPLPISAALLSALRQNGVRFAHWKSNLHLAEALAGKTDLDLLIDEGDAQAFRASMREVRGRRVISQPWASYPEVEDWLVFDGASGGFLHLHVHYILVTGLKRVKHLRLPWTQTVLSHLRNDPASNWPIPAASLELLILLIRIWAKMPPWRRLFAPRIPRHTLQELRWLEAEADAAEFSSLAASLGLTTKTLPPPGDVRAILAASRNLYGQVKKHYRMSWLSALIQAALLNLRLFATRIWLKQIGAIRYRKVLDGRGFMVALVGSDGSGKSTVSRSLLRWLHYKLDAHFYYMGSGDGGAGWVQRVRRGLSRIWRKTKRPRTRNSLRTETHKQESALTRIWRSLDLLLLQRKLRLLRQGRSLAAHGSIIVLDRYPQDQFNAICDGPRQQDGMGFGWAARAERALFAEAAKLGPELVIKLSIDPEIAHRRKPDHDLDVIRRKCAIIDDLRFPQAEVVVIDAAMAPDKVLLAAKTAIWEYLSGVPQQ
jgi:thymidylate kinase